ncbi:MAG: ATP-binding cassette domain-containing protein [Paludibacteraceae bacterium]|jgi:cell division transport system ATP-binding protein|nr:ATP-binding cassette domain-containing protein [Paludibacteraceae bacterium]MBR5469563.1 ATP-binding cassette domain-containing protein [Paludibacteraceae bacterium]
MENCTDILVNYECVDICQQEHLVLKDINFQVKKGEFIYLLGKVGSGKSSLLKSLYAEVPIKKGNASIFNYNLRKIKRKEIPLLRRKVGVIFQDFQLLIDRTVHENLKFVLKATGWKDKNKINEQIALVLQCVGMDKKGYKMPHQLSGGEQQRIVIARALLNSPELIIADEPTGNLDAETANDIVSLLHDICSSGTSVIMATHNINLINAHPGKIIRCEGLELKES